jgi:glycosyltransferase involved in cell wall biosynthesis
LTTKPTIEDLEAELTRTRHRLAAKERELVEIHRSRAWLWLTRFRALKIRLLDPLLGVIGLEWPRRRAALAQEDHSEAVEPARAGSYDVICFSTCEWDSRFQRPQQLMAQFAAAGHRVFYVSQLFRTDGADCTMTPKRTNIYEVTLRGAPLNVYTQSLGDGARDGLLQGVESLRSRASVTAAAMIVHLPFWWPLAQVARQRFDWPVIYDCIDLYAGFSTVRRAMVAQEDALFAQADVVIASSPVLEQHALRKRADAVLVRNGCDFEHFSTTAQATNARPVIGYYGAISDWFDSALVSDVATRRPDWDFILVGSTYGADLSRLSRLPNVSLPGEEPYESLPEWLGRFDVAIIPFKRTPLTEATNPVKVYEMLAAGRPIVSVPIAEVAALVPLVRIAATAEEFEREIEAALVPDRTAADARRAFARGQTWERRFESVSAAVTEAFSRRRKPV